MSVLLVIPCYCESKRLPVFLGPLLEHLADFDCTVQVVDDGSPGDEAAKIGALVEDLRPRFPRLQPLLALPRNLGKGGAIKAGWTTHTGFDQLAFTDADGSIAGAEVRRFLELARTEPGTAWFGSRIMMLGRTINRSPLRHLTGRVFATIASLRLEVPVYDTQCGLKVLPARAFSPRPLDFHENGFAFDLELLVSLLEQGFNVREVPIDWSHVDGSKVHLVRDAVAMYRALTRIQRRRPQWTSTNAPK